MILAPQVISSGGWTSPDLLVATTSAGQQIRLQGTVAAADATNLSKGVRLRLLYSTDSTTWRTWCGFDWRGTAAGRQPTMGAASPPPGSVCRLRAWSLGPQHPITVGAIVDIG